MATQVQVGYKTYGATEPLILQEVVVDENQASVNQVASKLFAEAYEQLNDSIASKNRCWKYLFIIPGGGGAVGVGCLIAFAAGAELNYLLGGLSSMVLSMCSGFGIGMLEESNMKLRYDCLIKTEAVTNFYNWFVYFKSSPKDHEVGSLFRWFEAMGADCLMQLSKHEVAVDLADINLFGSTGKVLLMDAVCQIFLQKNKSSSVVESWQLAKKTNTPIGFTLFWNGLGIAAPTPDSYLEANAYKETLNLDHFHIFLKNKFEATLQMALEAKVL